MEFAAGALSAGVGSTTLPVGSLYGGAAGRVVIREVGITNTTNTALTLKLVRLTTAGTRGTGLTNAELQSEWTGTPVGAAYNTHTSTGPTLGDDLGYRAVIAAAAGSGVVWVKGGGGIVIPATANAGVGIIVENGTGQIIQFYFVWEE